MPNNSPISDQLQESDFIYQFSFETKYKRPFDFRLLSKMILEAFLTFVFYLKICLNLLLIFADFQCFIFKTLYIFIFYIYI